MSATPQNAHCIANAQNCFNAHVSSSLHLREKLLDHWSVAKKKVFSNNVVHDQFDFRLPPISHRGSRMSKPSFK